MAFSINIRKQFYFIRKNLLLVKELSLRTLATGIMSPYIPHKEAFRFENAPRVCKKVKISPTAKANT